MDDQCVLPGLKSNSSAGQNKLDTPHSIGNKDCDDRMNKNAIAVVHTRRLSKDSICSSNVEFDSSGEFSLVGRRPTEKSYPGIPFPYVQSLSGVTLSDSPYKENSGHQIQLNLPKFHSNDKSTLSHMASVCSVLALQETQIPGSGVIYNKSQLESNSTDSSFIYINPNSSQLSSTNSQSTTHEPIIENHDSTLVNGAIELTIQPINPVIEQANQMPDSAICDKEREPLYLVDKSGKTMHVQQWYNDLALSKGSVSEADFNERLESESCCSESFMSEDVDDDIAKFYKLLGNAYGNRVTFNGDVFDASYKRISNRLKTQNDFYEKQLLELKLELEAVNLDKLQAENELRKCQKQLGIYVSNGEAFAKERELFKKNLAAVQKQLGEAEMECAEKQSEVDDRQTELNHLTEELTTTESEIVKAKIDFAELQMEARNKDAAIEALKKKITEMHVETQTTLQAQYQSADRVKALKSDLLASEKSREWLVVQLKQCQDDKSSVQQELISAHGGMNSTNMMVEKLRGENLFLKQQLQTCQQKSIKDKENVMAQLQTIEKDILERELALAEALRTSTSSDDVLAVKMKQLEQEKVSLTGKLRLLSDVEFQLECSRRHVEELEALMSEKGHEIGQYAKLNSILKKENEEKSHTLLKVEQKLSQLQRELEAANIAAKLKEEQLIALKSEKSAVEIELCSSKREKKEVDMCVQEVQQNFYKVDKNVKQTRKDLYEKTVELERLKKERIKMTAIKETLEQENLLLRKTVANFHASMNDRDKTIVDSSKQITTVQSELGSLRAELKRAEGSLVDNRAEIEALNGEVSVMNEKLDAEKQHNQKICAANAELEKEVANWKNQYTSLFKRQEFDERLGEDMIVTKQELARVENKLRVVCEEKRNLLARLSEVEMFVGDITTKQKGQQKATINMTEVDMIKTKLKISERNIAHASEDKRLLQIKLQELIQSKQMQDLYAEAQVHNLADTMINRMGVNRCQEAGCKHLAEIKELRRQTKEAHAAYKEKLRVYGSNIRLLTRKLKEFVKRDRQSSVDGFLDENNLEQTKVFSDMKDRLSAEQVRCQQSALQVEALRLELENLQAVCDEKAKEIESCNQIRVEHNLLADRITALQQQIVKEQQISKDIRKQLFYEKRQNSALKKEATSVRTGLDQANSSLDAKEQERQSMHAQIDNLLSSQSKLKSEVGWLTSELEKLKTEKGKLIKQLEDNKSKDLVLADQIKTMSWHMQQKSQETQNLDQQMKLIEERCRSELQANVVTLQTYQKELFEARKRLDSLNSEKQRWELQSKQLSTLLCKQPGDEGSGDALTVPKVDNASILELLQKSAAKPQIKPLVNLQGCVRLLKEEMNVLQQQIMQQHSQTNKNNNLDSLED